ncbi:hypothetical protein PQX77_009373 [Marasmius sp. AFHP31]|nr:hypothetical protein PQX77_009373 [Marasmius sp. AFHP31]
MRLIAICGAQSSLTLSLHYDGLNTGTLSLDALWSNMSIIPQVPELPSGTPRQNLDPFCQHDDVTLIDIMGASGLFKDLQTRHRHAESGETEENAKLMLDSGISSGGTNLSLGRRQILAAAARAILRKNKLLTLYEGVSVPGVSKWY